MAGLETQMRHRDRDMVPKVLVRLMFGLMVASLALVAFDQLSGRPLEGVRQVAPIVAERVVTLTGDRQGIYIVTDETGAVIASSEDELSGFIGVIGRVVDRQRTVERLEGNPPIRIVRREGGHVAIIDDAVDKTVELFGYGADNVAAFARLVE
jgi:putative photosynthetic complex assembly protein